MMKKVLNRASFAFRTFVLRQDLPYMLGLVITDTCNLNCFHCETKNKGKIHFSYNKAIKSLEAAYRRGHRSLYFTGGEPMIWRDSNYKFEDLVHHAQTLGFFNIFIFTNGTFPLTIKGCNYMVSIDGPKEIHNRIRENSYDLIMENVKKTPKNTVFASITFSKENFKFAEQCIHEITAMNLFRGIYFNLLTHWPEVVKRYGLSSDQRNELLDTMWALKKKGFPIVMSKAGYSALKSNDWKRPISQIELETSERVYRCCRDIGNPEICKICGYASCVEVAQALALKPSAIWQILQMVN